MRDESRDAEEKEIVILMEPWRLKNLALKFGARSFASGWRAKP
jgi:hypothetical protein